MIKIKRFMQLGVIILLMGSLFFFTNGSGYADDLAVTIKKGDTLYSIAKKYNLSVQELKEYNDLKNNTIYIGQQLLLPGLKQTEQLYVVVGGSFAKKANADKQVSLLKKKGIEAAVVKKVINNKSYYRIQAGVFSKKSNAEKQKIKLQNIGVKDAYILTQKPLHITGVQIGSTYKQVLNHFGKPVKTEDHLNIRSLYYQNEGAGIRVNFNMENGSVFGLQVYPEYLTHDSIPNEKSKVLDVYGYPNEVKKVTCYESASCQQFIYKFNKNKLIVQFDRDGKTVQYLDLGRLQ